MVRNACGAMFNSMMNGGATPAPQPVPVAPLPQQIVDVRRIAPKVIREVLAVLDDDEAKAIEQMLARLSREEYLAIWEEVEQLPDLNARVSWARRVIERMPNEEHAEAAEEPSAPTAPPAGVPGVPPELMPVLAQLSPEDQMLGLQLVALLDRATTEQLIARLSAMQPQAALKTIRKMIDEARRRSPSVAHRAVASALRDDEPRRNGAASNGGVS
jgi:hypothetical protein